MHNKCYLLLKICTFALLFDLTIFNIVRAASTISLDDISDKVYAVQGWQLKDIKTIASKDGTKGYYINIEWSNPDTYADGVQSASFYDYEDNLIGTKDITIIKTPIENSSDYTTVDKNAQEILQVYEDEKLGSIKLPQDFKWALGGITLKPGLNTVYAYKYFNYWHIPGTSIFNSDIYFWFNVRVLPREKMTLDAPKLDAYQGIAGEKLESIDLPKYYRWGSKSQTLNEGTNTYLAYYNKNSDVYEDSTLYVTVVCNEKETPKYTVPTGLTGMEDARLSSISLPTGFSWNSPNTLLTSGTNRYLATYTPTDIKTYKIICDISITVNVKAKPSDPNYKVPVGLKGRAGDKLSTISLPTGWRWNSTTTTIKEGTNSYLATYTPSNATTYKVVEDVSLSVLGEVYKVPDAPTGLEAAVNDKLSDLKLPEGFSWNTPSTKITSGINSYKATYSLNGLYQAMNIEVKGVTIKSPSNLQGVKGEPLSNVKLPDGWRWDNPSAIIKDNSSVFTATYTMESTGKEYIGHLIYVEPINKEKPKYTEPTGLSGRVGDTLSMVDLPKGFKWNDKNSIIGNGTKSYLATYTPDDTYLYEVVNNIPVYVKGIVEFTIISSHNNGNTILIGDTLSIKISSPITYTSGKKSLEYSVVIKDDKGKVNETKTNSVNGLSEISFSYNIPSSLQNSKTLTVDFTVKDSNGTEQKKSYKFTIIYEEKVIVTPVKAVDSSVRITEQLSFKLSCKESTGKIKSITYSVNGDNGQNIVAPTTKTPNANSDTISIIVPDAAKKYKSIVVNVSATDDKNLNVNKSFSYKISYEKLEFKATKTYKDNFKDVKSDLWSYGSIKTAYENELMKGVSDTEFNAAGNVTIAETIALAARMHNIFYDCQVIFNQNNGKWYDTYLNYSKAYGIIKEGQYTNYNAPATREQFVRILYNAIPVDKLKAINSISDNAIYDYHSGRTYASQVYAFYRAGILTGSNNYGDFMPDSYIRRDEVAAIVTRQAELQPRKTFALVKRPNNGSSGVNKG